MVPFLGRPWLGIQDGEAARMPQADVPEHSGRIPRYHKWTKCV
jgi:hypothetical protein